jgi:hypothetical protein
MAVLIINAVTYSGLPNGTGNASAWQPDSYTLRILKIGMTLEAADGTRNRVERSVLKREWDIGWSKTNNATRATLATLSALFTTFSFTDFDGNTYTCFIEDAFEPEWAFNNPAGASFWNCAIKIRQS